MALDDDCKSENKAACFIVQDNRFSFDITYQHPFLFFRLFLQCSSDCGQGVRRRTVSCTNPQGLCDPLSQPTQEEPCEDHSKCYEWKTGDWSKV